MKLINSLIGGFAGAIALNIVHEIARHLDHDAPQIHKIGEEAIIKITEAGGIEPPEGNQLYATALQEMFLVMVFIIALSVLEMLKLDGQKQSHLA